MRLTIEKVVYPGKSLGHHDGKVIFTDEGLPGELVDVDIQQEKKRFAAGTTRTIVTCAADRVAPRCAHYRTCARYQSISYPLQLSLKHQQLREILRTHLESGMDLPPLEPSRHPWGYRNKLQAQTLVLKDGTCRTGYHQPQSRQQYVPFDDCFLVSDRINQALGDMRTLLAQSRALHVQELVIRESRSQENVLVLLRGPVAAKNSALSRGGEQLYQAGRVAAVLFQTVPGRHMTPLFGENLMTEKIAGKTFFFGAASFLQINIVMLESLIAHLRALLPLSGPTRIIDLFAGVGTFGLSLGTHASEGFFVESEPENVAFLKRNVSALAPRSRSIAGRAETVLQRLTVRPRDVIILDPPRTGLHPQLCRQLVRTPAHTLAYISCDPMTLARDLTILNAAYQLTSVKSFDFFPQTPHIETCCVLKSR